MSTILLIDCDLFRNLVCFSSTFVITFTCNNLIAKQIWPVKATHVPGKAWPKTAVSPPGYPSAALTPERNAQVSLIHRPSFPTTPLQQHIKGYDDD